MRKMMQKHIYTGGRVRKYKSTMNDPVLWLNISYAKTTQFQRRISEFLMFGTKIK